MGKTLGEPLPVREVDTNLDEAAVKPGVTPHPTFNGKVVARDGG